MSSEEKFNVFGIRPAGCSGWLMVEAADIAQSIRDNSDDEECSEWVIKLFAPMTRDEIEAAPEFDGW